MLYVAVVFLPLLGAILAGVFGKKLGDQMSQIVTSVLTSTAALIGIYLFYDVALLGNKAHINLLTWMNVGGLTVQWSIFYDTLTAVMVFVVLSVSALVHIYSIGYMHHDKSIPRFMSYLSLFTFAMLMLVTGDNLIQMFFGWEGVGVCSYLLIGYYYDKPSAGAAAMKAFIVNRVGDFGFALGIMGVFFLFGTVSYDAIFAGVEAQKDASFDFLGMSVPVMTTLCLMLFVGAMGKSAQLGLHTWLPDAMEGPTPVSALIHAATMVTAGVFMLARLSPMFEYAPDALTVVTIFGAVTALFAATVGLTQTDIKRVIAYSTCSQLGYMFFACGVSAYPAAIFHLMTHAFFKALLFLGAGSVIHAMSDEQDMRNMGGVWRKIRKTYAMMWIGSLALAGVGIPTLVGFAGFYSKDMILESAFGAHTGVGNFAYYLGVTAAFLTAFYSWRLLFMTFHGTPRADDRVMAHIHESPNVMLIPLYLLAFGAIFAGALAYETFVGHHWGDFWRDAIFILPTNQAMDHAHHVPFWVKALPLVVTLLGIGLAYIMYIMKPDLPAACARLFKPLYMFSFRKWYFDELYDAVFVKRSFDIGKVFWKVGDVKLIDGLGPNGMAWLTNMMSKRASLLQTGYVYHYAFAMIIGIVVFASWQMFFAG